jgi:predicted acetyltransferase
MVERPSAHVSVMPAAPQEEPVVANLLQLYAHDFSEFHDVELGLDGRFVYKELPRYWRESNRHPFLVRVDDTLAGFALVKRGSEISGNASVWDMAEFFVLRAYRRRGVGMEGARQVWRKFPGPWEVRVMEANRSALVFWERAIAGGAGRAMQAATVEKDAERWNVFSFESRVR